MVRGTPSTQVDGGSALTVTALYDAIGVQIGDEVPLSGTVSLLSPSDVVFADWNSDSHIATFQFVAHATDAGDPSVIIRVKACSDQQIAIVPGTLPLSILEQALAAKSTCESVLGDYDPDWQKVQGLGACPGQSTGGTTGSGGVGGTTSKKSDSDEGCNFGPHPSFGASAVFVLSAAVALASRRRSR
jgi:hypothetical protein